MPWSARRIKDGIKSELLDDGEGGDGGKGDSTASGILMGGGIQRGRETLTVGFVICLALAKLRLCAGSDTMLDKTEVRLPC